MAAKSILQAYTERLDRLQSSGVDNIEYRPFGLQELLLLTSQLHPTRRKESLALTKALMGEMLRVQIATTEELKTSLGAHVVPIRKRLMLLRKFGLVRQESRIYHLSTPRLEDFVNNYLGSVVKWD